MSMKSVNEGSTARLTVSFADADGAPAAPDGLTYRIDDLTSGTQMVGDTVLTPAASVVIVLSPAVNVAVGNRRVQHRRVIVKATYGVNDGLNAEYEYELINLGGVT